MAPEATPIRWQRKHTWLAVGLLSLVLALWRAHLVGLGPDPDSDAYGHHVIARKVLASPGAHGVHWVWLPLFHWLQVPLVALGGGMDVVRYVNVVVWAAVPLVLVGYLLKKETHPAVTALAGFFCALCPIGMQMGTTAQPEPVFGLLLLGFTWDYDQRRFGWAAVVLSTAVLLRYEAWAVLLGVGIHQAVRLLRRRKLRDVDGWGYLAPVIAPGLAVLAWALVRWPVDGRFLGFVLDTRRFATEVHASESAFEGGFITGLRDCLYYVYDVAFRVYGWAILLFPLGLWATLRRYPGLALSGVGALGFVTLTWVMRGTLGLDRHFVAVIPFYATAMALGVESLARLVRQRTNKPWVGPAIAAPAALAALALITWGMVIWMGHWRGSIAGGYRDRIAVADFLRRAPADALIVCDEATVEVLSGLDRTRFDRRSPAGEAGAERVLQKASEHEVYVATWLGNLKALQPHGTIVFRPEDAPEDGGLAVMVVPAP